MAEKWSSQERYRGSGHIVPVPIAAGWGSHKRGDGDSIAVGSGAAHRRTQNVGGVWHRAGGPAKDTPTGSRSLGEQRRA